MRDRDPTQTSSKFYQIKKNNERDRALANIFPFPMPAPTLKK
jgi:hypothetical protein